MLFVLIGIAMVVVKALSLVPLLNDLSWWWCLAPFVAAFVYWEIIDSGLGISSKLERRKQKKQAEEHKKQQIKDLYSTELPDQRKGARRNSRR